MRVAFDLARGGRWSSLRARSGREWLWHRGPPSWRDGVRAGASFVDIGGADECIPTITGEPDHGSVWTCSWHGSAAYAAVETGSFSLRRRLRSGDGRATAVYELEASPGFRFLWAWHALLVPDHGLEVAVPAGHRARVWPRHDGPPKEAAWPQVVEGTDWSRLGENDGTATWCLLPGLAELSVRGGADRLGVRLEVADQPFGIGLWRNLGGFPWDGSVPYRSFGVEPMLGHVHALAKAGPGEAAVVPASGQVTWQLVLEEG